VPHFAVAGGDGTVQRAAVAAMNAGIPLAVLPAGTFNHFAKDLGMYPLRTAIGALHAGTVAKVDLGEVNGRVFVNTASVGAYTDFVAIRERNEKRIGKPSPRSWPPCALGRASGTRALPGSER
jgi:undecaprenyl-diphosphatase